MRVVRAALKHVEEGDLDCQPGGVRRHRARRAATSASTRWSTVCAERERVRDLFGRHVGREVAAAAEQQRPKLGGEERHVAVIFVDIIGSRSW